MKTAIERRDEFICLLAEATEKTGFSVVADGSMVNFIDFTVDGNLPWSEDSETYYSWEYSDKGAFGVNIMWEWEWED